MPTVNKEMREWKHTQHGIMCAALSAVGGVCCGEDRAGDRLETGVMVYGLVSKIMAGKACKLILNEPKYVEIFITKNKMKMGDVIYCPSRRFVQTETEFQFLQTQIKWDCSNLVYSRMYIIQMECKEPSYFHQYNFSSGVITYLL